MALGQTSLIVAFAKAYLGTFCGIKFIWKHYCFTGGRKKIRAYKMNMLKSYNQYVCNEAQM